MVMEDTPEQDEEPIVQGEVGKEEREQLLEDYTKKLASAKALEEQTVEPMEGAARYRIFVAPLHKNARFLAKPGTLIQFRDPASPTGTRDARRDGDVWVKFVAGLCVTDDPDVIAWCEKNPDTCRDTKDPRTAIWARLQESKVPLANREPLVDQSLVADMEQAMYGQLGEDLTLKPGGAAEKLTKEAEQAAVLKAERDARGQ